MSGRFSDYCRRAGLPLGLSILILFPAVASAAGNLWRDSYGQGWFYETRSSGGQTLAGSWWQSALTPGKTYTITFEVKRLEGVLGLHLGDLPMIAIDSTGRQSFDFAISQGGKRRLMFTAARRTDTNGNGTRADDKILASVAGIAVTETAAAATPVPQPAPVSAPIESAMPSAGSEMPKGHYLSFAREVNLKREMLNFIDQPSRAPSDWHLQYARNLHGALTTPGVKGFWVEYPWRRVETGDGVYQWSELDDNMEVARRLGLRFIVKVADRSFNGRNIMPAYFPAQYVLQTWGNGGGGNEGYTAKRWDPWVYNRIIRLYKAIIARYGSDPGFGGIATTESAPGKFTGGDYNVQAYKTALTQIATQTQAAMQRGKLFWYLNFLPGAMNRDMRKDGRVEMVRQVPHEDLVVGGPDVTPDAHGMPGSSSSYRIHVRKNLPGVEQFCHMQHVDQGRALINVKSNRYRQDYFAYVERARQREQSPWFNGQPAVFEFDDLRDPQGRRVDLHPNSVLGDLWHPRETFAFATRNFDCDYFFWHYREPKSDRRQFWWPDIQPIILNNQYFYQ